jgi:Uma2 family endonuclease
MHRNIALDLAIYLKQHWGKPQGGRVNQEVNLTTPEDEAQWTHNYRIPDLVLLSPDRFGIDKNEYMAGAPLVVVELKSPGDDTYEKFPFYAGLGVPEVWVFDRTTRVPELYTLGPGPAYQPIPAGPDGWVHSPATGVAFRPTGAGTVTARIGTDPATVADLPDA